MNVPRILMAAAAVLLVSGCLQDTQQKHPPVSSLYPDAQERFMNNRVNGSEATTKEFTVPEGKGKLIVFAQYTIDGSASFSLDDPSNQPRHQEAISGGKSFNNTTWAQVDNPPAGVWHLKISISGSGQYAFGVYLSGVAAPAAPPLYADAKMRITNKVEGAESVTKNIDIPPGAAKLTIKAMYHVEGAADFILRDVALTKNDDQVSGSKDYADQTWYETTNPVPGTWRLQIDVSGSAEYTFGVYY